MPASVTDTPDLLPGLLLYLQAFFELDTERSEGHHMPGPIPSSRMRAHGRMLGLRGDDLTYFCEVIRSVDDWKLTKLQSEIRAAYGQPSATQTRSKFGPQRGRR